MALSLVAQQEAELLDLVDQLDDVDPSARASMEEAIDRGDDLSDLPILIRDLTFSPRSRDGAITFFFSFSRRRWWPEQRLVTGFLVGLAVGLDELLFAPESYGSPPDEQRRIQRCESTVRGPPEDPIDARARASRFEALECGGRT